MANVTDEAHAANIRFTIRRLLEALESAACAGLTIRVAITGNMREDTRIGARTLQWEDHTLITRTVDVG